MQSSSLGYLGWWGCPFFSSIIYDNPVAFCGSNEIGHYFCDIFPMLKIACADSYITGVLPVANSGMVSLVTFVVLFVSYVIILFTLRNPQLREDAKPSPPVGLISL